MDKPSYAKPYVIPTKKLKSLLTVSDLICPCLYTDCIIDLNFDYNKVKTLLDVDRVNTDFFSSDVDAKILINNSILYQYFIEYKVNFICSLSTRILYPFQDYFQKDYQENVLPYEKPFKYIKDFKETEFIRECKENELIDEIFSEINWEDLFKK